jgi:hypothetical protein
MEANTAMMVGGAVGGAIGGAVGVVGSLATSLAPHLWQRSRDRRAARAIARAYISGILRMEKIRDHAGWYEQVIAVIELDEARAINLFASANVDVNDFLRPSLVAQLGLLHPEVAADIMLFLNMHDGLRLSLKGMSLGQLNDRPRSEKLRALRSDWTLWQDTIALGTKLVERLHL